MMQEADDLIETREIDVKCWQCEWHDGRTLQWLSGQRHMNCPHCDSVIVLDTSNVRREIARQRRQLSALRDQMGKLLEEAGKVSRLVTRPPLAAAPASRLDLALAKKHPGTQTAYMRPAAAARRFSS